MRGSIKFFSLLLAAVLFTGILSVPAMAAVTSVKSTGDGAVEIKWDDADAYELVLVPKMSDDFDADLAAYGVIVGETEGRTKVVIYMIAPGQSYWVYTRKANGDATAPYAYKAAKAPDFTDFKNPVHFTKWVLLEKTMQGKYNTLDYYPSWDMETALQEGTSSYGVRLQYEWPKLKNARSYLCQVVIMSPDGDKYGFNAFQQELPAGYAAAYNDYLPLDDYFEYLLEQRGSIPVGTYRFTLYWDGQNVCSETFKVR